MGSVGKLRKGGDHAEHEEKGGRMADAWEQAVVGSKADPLEPRLKSLCNASVNTLVQLMQCINLRKASTIHQARDGPCLLPTYMKVLLDSATIHREGWDNPQFIQTHCIPGQL